MVSMDTSISGLSVVLPLTKEVYETYKASKPREPEREPNKYQRKLLKKVCNTINITAGRAVSGEDDRSKR